jgi:polysaccharide biosynthesis/export protein
MRYLYCLLFALIIAVTPQRSLVAATSDSGLLSTSDATLGADASSEVLTGASTAASTGAYQDFFKSTKTTIIRSELGKQTSTTVNSNAQPNNSAVTDSTLIRLMQKKSSFQTYVETATGQELEVFGRNLFRGVPSTFAPLSDVQVNPDYVIGPGDALQIRAWGMVNIDIDATVSRSGEIYIPEVGSVRVSGVRYRDLQGYLKTAVGRIFRNFELSASVAQTRSVQIYVVGNAFRPGAYTLSAMSTILNALFVSGGPSTTGSLRNIKLKRGSDPMVSFDLYNLLLFGDKSSDVALKDGDVLYIPPVGPQVALFGDVKNPAIYELKQKTSVADLVGWAGGFESSADLKNVIVDKNIDGNYQTQAELQSDWTSIQSGLSKLQVMPTDIFRIISPGSYPIEVKVKRSFVRIDGEVKKSGVYELQPGETLKGLIARVGGVTEKGFLYGTRLTRESVRRDQQKKITESIDRYEKDIETSAKQRIAGANDVAQAASVTTELETQRRIVKKLRSVKPEGRIILSLKNAQIQLDTMPEFPLRDGDQIYIPERPTTVDVIGAVNNQSTFIYNPQYRVSSYLDIAGGVTDTGQKSHLYRICADGTVKTNTDSQVNPGDAIVVPERLKPKFNVMRALTDFTTVLYQFGVGAATIKILTN